MASSKVRPTPPPRGPALARPAVGALLLTLSGAACGDDKGTGDTANDSQPPMADEGPMPNPTTDDTTPPMANPTTGTSTTTAGDDSSTGPIPPMPPPMPNPTETDGTTGDGTTGTGSGGTTEIPPMPPPTSGVLPGDEPE
ncbi:hypothetical protein [Paraliomyxa miuraensis]|uniref:hypothetical protein n=1 Tax=Paraliomyxa miuraensis TaxID=376150 RepID=UPI002258E31A|nr:hypothetical protein [Paraliomyxa miuraensis]MCX4244114.1 hypothetical protein [Paraliomyxa miuraensis]